MPALDQTSHSIGERRPGAPRRPEPPESPQRRRAVRADPSAAAVTFHALLDAEPSTASALLAPPTPARHVPRPRLLRRLQGADEASVVLLAAPAGYGKSTLLSEWSQSTGRPVAWLTLTALDNDPEMLLERLAQALAQLASPWPTAGGEHDTAATDPGPRRIDLARLPAPLRAHAATLNAIGCDRLLVLDDVHNLRSPDAVRILAELIGAGCAQLQVALASRAEPALGLARLRASGELLQLGPEDLEMTADEARRLLSAAGLEIDEPDLLALVDYTEGWAAALFLAAVLLRSRQDADASAVEAVRDATEVDEYVREEILAPLTATQRRFLIRTSVLPWLSPGVCDAMLEMEGSGEVMRLIAHRSLMLTPQHGTQGSYRCHSLVRDVLRRGLEMREPGEVTALHARASAWLAEHDDLEGAIDHAVAGRDPLRSGDLIWSHGTRFLANLDGRLTGWLSALGEEQVAQSPSLSLAAAFEALARGDAASCERWGIRTAAALGRDGEDGHKPARGRSGGREDWLWAGVSLARAAGAPRGIPEMAAEATKACELLDEASPMRPLACLLRGVALQLVGDALDGRTALEEAVRGTGEPTVRVEALALTELALADSGDGEWELAADRLARAREVLAAIELERDPTFAMTYAVAALVGSELGRGDDAKRDLATAARLLGELGDYMGWYEVQARTVMARACARLADVARARTLLAEASRWARRTNRVESLVAALDTAWGEVDDVCAAAADGPGLLTIAELRILRFLPTHLSFREIGERLHVSGNTVKTQAHAVYTKLGAGSRSEAVAKAASIGLIDVTIV
jgi:LuxR family transcriptional regulator, maltose regulon positive regulatory protein